MPVILPVDSCDLWLGHDRCEPMNFLKPYPIEEMEVYPVSSLVGSPAGNSPEFINPI
jgi:putative SOS response-associated peptidase YedK